MAYKYNINDTKISRKGNTVTVKAQAVDVNNENVYTVIINGQNKVINEKHLDLSTFALQDQFGYLLNQ